MFHQPSGVDVFRADRLFGETSGELKAIYESDLTKLSELPVLALTEIYRGEGPRPAFVGRIDHIERLGRDIRFRFEHWHNQFSAEEVFGCGYFDIDIVTRGINESNRTHWAIKQGNLMEGILRLLNDRSKDHSPKAFNVTQWPIPTLSHVAVMMPFDSTFEAVYTAVKESCNSLRLETLRVDEIYSPSQISTDIFKAIEQSKLVVSDLTGRNPNVLYETGLAHARDRDVIMITQDAEDVPFDLNHIRYIKYLANRQGLEQLTTDLREFIRAIDDR